MTLAYRWVKPLINDINHLLDGVSSNVRPSSVTTTSLNEVRPSSLVSSRGHCMGSSNSKSKTKQYKATMPTVPFAFYETKIIAEIMLREPDHQAVKAEVHEGNLLNVKTKSNEDKIFDYIFNRLSIFPESLTRLIITSDEQDARFVNLISIMNYDVLFREFIFEVYFEALDSRNPITDYDIMTFFERKGREADYVADWSDVTKFKLRRLYTRILFEAGFLKESSGIRELSAPYISLSVISMLCEEGFEQYVKALRGRI